MGHNARLAQLSEGRRHIHAWDASVDHEARVERSLLPGRLRREEAVHAEDLQDRLYVSDLHVHVALPEGPKQTYHVLLRLPAHVWHHLRVRGAAAHARRIQHGGGRRRRRARGAPLRSPAGVGSITAALFPSLAGGLFDVATLATGHRCACCRWRSGPQGCTQANKGALFDLALLLGRHLGALRRPRRRARSARPVYPPQGATGPARKELQDLCLRHHGQVVATEQSLHKGDLEPLPLLV
mmetsp:Transcript_89533/g.200071  ORF Transcript_89533/g.200071 Transcript_89533/m.200071 type:complete len:240 (+) Transcript_89533:815-1534(+)